jgi:hypothetical protein
MICAHGNDEREECQSCDAAYRAQTGKVPWRKVDECLHRAQSSWGRCEAMGTAIADDTGRVLRGTCEPCGTALLQKGKRR